MIETIVMLGVAIVIAVVLWYFLKNVSRMVINSVVGIVLLLVFNFFNLFGAGEIPVTIGSILVCALGGIPGFIILLLLNLVGITI